ncbi:MAG: hypothetical protein LBQ66_04360 [Planctomycetaceae bacterium]|jgi:hypothetical protein|nr:hypothetical protein [Planctomycetaceae bacterium]
MIEEIVGFNSSVNSTLSEQTRVYFVTADSPEAALDSFRTFAQLLDPPSGFELSSYEIDEEKRANGVYFGKIIYTMPKVKSHIADDLEELFGEQKNVTRRSGSHTRVYRVKAIDATAALTRLETYIRAAMPTSGRLQINDISVDENADSQGWFTGRVVYSNPDTKSGQNVGTGLIATAYGDRVSLSPNDSVKEQVYELRGFNSADEASIALRSSISLINLDEIQVEEDSNGGDKIYMGRVRYKVDYSGGDGGNAATNTSYVPSYSLEISGSQTKMMQSLWTDGAYAVYGRSPRDYGGLIGVTDDGVEGVDVDVSASMFTETHYFNPDFLTADFVVMLNKLYGYINHKPWRGYEECEVRFMGITGQWRADDVLAELTFKFAVSLNKSNFYVGDIKIARKYGWDYLWTRWQNVEENGIIIKKPIEAYCEAVYESIDFRVLGIGR